MKTTRLIVALTLILLHAPALHAQTDERVELIELAFDTDPLVPDASATPAVVAEGGYLTITITRQAGVTYSVQSAVDPANASYSATTTTVLIGTPPARFLRVLVAAAP